MGIEALEHPLNRPMDGLLNIHRLDIILLHNGEDIGENLELFIGGIDLRADPVDFAPAPEKAEGQDRKGQGDKDFP